MEQQPTSPEGATAIQNAMFRDTFCLTLVFSCLTWARASQDHPDGGHPSHPPGAHEHKRGILLLRSFSNRNKNINRSWFKALARGRHRVLEGARAHVFSASRMQIRGLVGDRLSKGPTR